MSTSHDLVLVVDFGAQYAQLIARRVRECHVYSEVVPHTITAEEIRARAPKAVILSGGPSSVYAEGAPQISPGFFDTAHTSVWRLDPGSLDLEHTADLFFRRPDRPGVFGDHATHLVRTADGWLVATSTWGDFETPTTRAGRPSSTRIETFTRPSPSGVTFASATFAW